ncbi:MAG: phosphate signaling complex protein PhoU [Tissierellia bacterium]|nr:phosphate signaling complex protein PhoU [Tissierellia bacterium]
MRRRFSEQLMQLNTAMIRMGALCEEAISIVAVALQAKPGDESIRVRAIEREIDAMERDIESLCLKLILQQQPVAGDLRQITTAMKMITDLERIGDQCADIAEILAERAGETIDIEGKLAAMAKESGIMVTESVEAFVHKDINRAQWVVDRDQVVDDFFRDIKLNLSKQFCCEENGEMAMDMLMVAKYLERIGDHAVNVAQWVIYAVTGEHRGE